MPDAATIEQDAGPPAQEPANVARLRIAVAIATAGRPLILAQMLVRLEVQTRHPDAIFVCAPEAADVDGIAEAFPTVALVPGPRGLAHQRNAILRRLESFDVALFFDDDFVPAADYIERVEALMLARPDVVMTTGSVIRDGIRGPGLSFDEADEALRGAELQDAPQAAGDGDLKVASNGYGCNMSVRLAAVREHAVYFDESLPLYAWLEDVDFGSRLGRHGRVVMLPASRGVHLGIKSGRQAGIKLGYSQIANPIYLARKGTCSWRRSFYLMSRNIAANIARSFRPEPWVDRRGRLAGNLIALVDLFSARLEPVRAQTL